jgi:hypothetical protein
MISNIDKDDDDASIFTFVFVNNDYLTRFAKITIA